MDITLHRSKPVKGVFTVPGDKSISHRALMLAAISAGRSVIRGLSSAADVESTKECLRALGVPLESEAEEIAVEGRGRFLSEPHHQLNAGNSGTTLRLLTGILVGQRFDSTISGDASLQRRPMKRIVEPLTAMGASISATPDGTPPLRISGGRLLRRIRFEPPIPSAQVKSSILFASLFAEGVTEIIEPIQTRDHTERMLGLRTEHLNGRFLVRMEGEMQLEGRVYDIPGDISSAAFLIVAATIVPHSELRVVHVGLNSTRTGFLDILREAGAHIEIEPRGEVNGEPIGDIAVKAAELPGKIAIPPSLVPSVIDEIPILSIAGLAAQGGFEVRGARELRVKESDRLSALVQNIRALGCTVEDYEDGFAAEGGRILHGAVLESFGDHRIAMAFGVAAMIADGETTIRGAESAAVSFPDFWTLILPFQR